MINNNPRGIHTTVLNEIVGDIVKLASVASEIVDKEDVKKAASAGLKHFQDLNKRGYGSLVKAAENLTLVFPVLASKTITINTDILIAKAIERKAVSMLQMVFAAMQIADKNVEDVYGYIAKFHKNLSDKEFTVDDLIAINDLIQKESTIYQSNKTALYRRIHEQEMIKAVTEDNVKNTNYYLESSANNNSLSRFNSSNAKNGTIVREASVNSRGNYDWNLTSNGRAVRGVNAVPPKYDALGNKIEDINGELSAQELIELRKKAIEEENKQNVAAAAWYNLGKDLDSAKADLSNAKRIELEKQLRDLRKQWDNIDKEEDAEREDKFKREFEKFKAELNKVSSDATLSKTRADFFKTQVLDSDIKKANELQPSLMVVNFFVNNDKNQLEPIKDAVIGVKAKLYTVDSNDIIEKITSKADDQSGLVKFIRATTREISFFKDFLFAVDKAKIDVIDRHNRGSKAKIWQVLERRAEKYKTNKYAGTATAAPISTLVISQEEVEYLKKMKGFDLESYRYAKKVFDGYNFMCICIVDENLEVAKFLYDTGEDKWEVYSFTSLDREASDGTYKKVVNLLTKVR